MNTRKQLSLLIFFSLLAASMVGVSYALWDKYLYIQGTIDTGTVEAIWTDVSGGDYGTQLDPEYGPAQYKDKHVGWTDLVEGLQSDKLVIKLHNAYPCYYIDYEIEWTYIGTVPAHLVAVNIIPENFVLSSAYGADDGEIWIDIPFVEQDIGEQFHLSEGAAWSLKIHVEQPAKQNWEYRFSIELVFEQWNEASV